MSLLIFLDTEDAPALINCNGLQCTDCKVRYDWSLVGRHLVLGQHLGDLYKYISCKCRAVPNRNSRAVSRDSCCWKTTWEHQRGQQPVLSLYWRHGEVRVRMLAECLDL